MTPVRSTPDAYLGLDDPTDEAWERWHDAMKRERVEARLPAYRDPATDWSDTTFRQLFLFMYDVAFYDRDAKRYRTRELVERWRTMFGRVDSVLLWHAYPRLGFDSRTQFDFYRDMPGGLPRLRAQVSDVLHAHGIKVFVDYNPWAEGSYDELGEIVVALDADGVMLDTMTDAPEELARAVSARRPGVVFAPELRPKDSDLGHLRQSWAQWSDLGDGSAPSILRLRWLSPRHRQLSIRRWDRSRRDEIGYSFWCGSGLILWDNIFGTHNPYAPEDRRLLAETAAILDHYQDVFVHGEWRPLVPTGVRGLDANRWIGSSATILTLRNRTAERLEARLAPDEPRGVVFWGARDEARGGDTVVVEPGAVQALVWDEDADRARAALAHFHALSRRAAAVALDYDERRRPYELGKAARIVAPRQADLIELPGTDAFDLRIRHERRESGCYPDGATDDAMWGWFYKDTIEHRLRVAVSRFAIRRTAVTNDELLAFVHAARYRPDDEERFLAHLRKADGSLPETLPGEIGRLPVTYVSLPDARAYAAWCGQRLPTEAEWQWASEGAGLGHVYPWGNDPRSFAPGLRPARDELTATPQGVMGLSGNAWELTESERSDGHTRFVMLRGGVFLPPGESEWLPARGARPNDHHAKYILLSEGLDRSETVSFRTVVDCA